MQTDPAPLRMHTPPWPPCPALALTPVLFWWEDRERPPEGGPGGCWPPARPPTERPSSRQGPSQQGRAGGLHSGLSSGSQTLGLAHSVLFSNYREEPGAAPGGDSTLQEPAACQVRLTQSLAA